MGAWYLAYEALVGVLCKAKVKVRGRCRFSRNPRSLLVTPHLDSFHEPIRAKSYA